MSSEAVFKSFLEANGFRVKKIQEGEGKSPDFLVSGKTHTYLIEVKDKLPNPYRAACRDSVLQSGEMFQSLESTGRANSISSVVKEGCDQLAAFKSQEVDVRLLWFHERGIDPELQTRQICSTLYGIKMAIPVAVKSAGRNCFYSGFNDFYRFKHILDGVATVRGQIGQFCINSFSPASEALRESDLVGLFGQGVIDPESEEASGNAFIADFDCDREDRPLFLKRLARKYGYERMVEAESKCISAEISASKTVVDDDAT